MGDSTMGKSNRRAAGWIAAVLGIGALAFAGWWVLQPATAAAEDEGGFQFVLPVTLTQVERGSLMPTAELSGTVRAARRARLSFEAEGTVVGIEVAEADSVEHGELLARLSSGDERYVLSLVNAALQLAQRELELLQAGEREEEKRRLFAVLEAARAEAELAELEVERARPLTEERILSQSELDALAAKARAADKRRAAAEEAHAQALAGTRPEEIAIARARVDEAEARVATAQHDLEKTELHAPWRGSIVQRMVSVGDYVGSGQAVFELVDLENLEVHLEIPGRYGPRLGRGVTVRLRTPSDGVGMLETELDATIQAADEAARSFRAIVRLTGDEAQAIGLAPGLFCNATLLFQSLDDVLCVPSDAVMSTERGNHVVRAVAAPGAGPEGRPGLTAEFVPVRILAQAAGRSAVEPLFGSLSEGDALCLVGADNAFPGAPLMPRETPDASAGPHGGAPEGQGAGR